MRKARYSLKQVICKNSSCIGHSSNVAKPGYWLTYKINGATATARVLGRIDATDEGIPCVGYLAVVRLHFGGTFAGIAWVHPDEVTDVYQNPPAELFAWITGAEWVKNKHDIARIVAMSEHGTLSESYIASRNDPEKAYNARPEYINQFVM